MCFLDALSEHGTLGLSSQYPTLKLSWFGLTGYILSVHVCACLSTAPYTCIYLYIYIYVCECKMVFDKGRCSPVSVSLGTTSLFLRMLHFRVTRLATKTQSISLLYNFLASQSLFSHLSVLFWILFMLFWCFIVARCLHWPSVVVVRGGKCSHLLYYDNKSGFAAE